MLRKLLHVSLLSICILSLDAQGYEIKVKIKAYQNDTLLLGYHFGDKTYLKDTAIRKSDVFTFKDDTLLEGGMYLLVLKPNNDFIQILIDKDNQKFSCETDTNDLSGNIKFKNSKLNQEFYDYLDFLDIQRQKGDSLNALYKVAGDENSKTNLTIQLNAVDQEVKARQKAIFEKPQLSLLSLLLKLGTEPEVPDFEGNEEEIKEKSFYYYRSHYFDLIDLSDDRIVRLPLFHGKIDRYLNKLTSQIPDSINKALDVILGKAPAKSYAFKYILSTWLTHYANSKYVGMDAVYVHLVDNYYSKGMAYWLDEELLAKMMSDAKTLKPLLLDQIAPDITVYKQDGTPVRLHKIQSEYTILYIWAPDCGHCKSSMPHLIKFYENYKDKGVEVLALCSKVGEDEKTCWEGVQSLHMESLVNTSDPFHRSKFRLTYDVKTTPVVYILDKNKKILTKKISAEQLPEVMEKLMAMDKNED
ncbi:MAG: redoxin domain-containing protein [Saprospiraceae bacterium]|nr:redoxin domain-containing protein [Saprospiraceae bacterium]